MAHNFVRGDGLDQRYHVVGLEITYLFLNLADDFKVVDRELELGVNIDLIADLPQCITHHKHVSAL